ncbi:PQQ-binding-like beta-propeller repeat protein [bacterium]|nr:PQQ-binding-like beta-propeller repeat protein [bacterium]
MQQWTHRFVGGLLLLALAPLRGENWPQFRGTHAAGVAPSEKLPIEWGPDKNIAWKIEIPGAGWSSPIVWQDRIFLTTAIADQPEEAPKTGLYFGGERKDPPKIHYDYRVICLNARDGAILWNQSVGSGLPSRGKHIKNTYASETPVTNGRQVFAYFPFVGLVGLDMEGNILWKQDLGVYPTKAEWGTGSSPIADASQVYFQCDNEDKSFIAAYDAESGAEHWKIPREERTNWSTPFLWQAGGRTEIVTSGKNKARSYDPATGNLIWELGGMSSIVVTTPVANADFCFVSSGYVMDQKNRPIFAVRPGAKGDISLEKEATTNQSIAWSQRLGGAYMPTPIVYGERLFVLYDKGFFGAFATKTGEMLYKRERLPQVANFTASPWAYRDRIFCLAESGETYVIEASDKLNVLAIQPPLDESLFMATPAVADDTLLIRGSHHLYGIREGASPSR